MYNEAAALTGKPSLPPSIVSHHVSRLRAVQSCCMLHIFLTRSYPTDEDIAALNDEDKKIHAHMQSRRNINIRVLNDFDSSTLKTRRLDGKTLMKGDYVNP